MASLLQFCQLLLASHATVRQFFVFSSKTDHISVPGGSTHYLKYTSITHPALWIPSVNRQLKATEVALIFGT
jgi:hypothetical protein